GGTIGGDLRYHSIVDSGLQAKAFRERLCKELGGEQLLKDIVLPDFLTPVNRFSEQMAPNDWGIIARKIYECVKSDKPDGIVVLHGTDTLAFTAAALSFLLLGIDVPVIVTGSNYPLMAPASDAKRNFLDSIRVACDRRFRGVFVVYSGNPNEPSLIH